MTNVPPEAPPPQAPPPVQPPTQPPANDANQMAMLAHLLGIVGFIPSLIIWQVKKEIPFVAQEAKEALNFQISVGIVFVGLWILSAMLLFIFWPLYMLFHVLALGVWVANIVFCILGAMKAKDGIAYRYPFAIRLIK